jgi:heme/copper-type cytochrome/quinol oxidase subunit 4
MTVGAIRVPSRIKRYFKENLGTPFITGFIIILLVAAVSVATGSGSLANELAVYAYYALVVGVVLQLVCFLKYNKRNGQTD